MTINDKIRFERLQHTINREAAKVLALSSGKIDQYENLAGEEMLPLDQSRIVEQAKYLFSFEKIF